VDESTVEGFGVEWERFDQTRLPEPEFQQLFDKYFRIFDWKSLPAGAEGFDAGCGSGRWARGVAPRVGTLHCVDASPAALAVAERSLAGQRNCRFHCAPIAALPFADGSMDFGYSLGVLHHMPDTAAGLAACVRKLKPGAPFLVYLYYAFDNRPSWYRMIWQGTDLVRRGVSRMPAGLRVRMADLLAATVYWPLARTARLAERAGADVTRFPLSFYRDRSFYTMRTDSLDRFGTRLEQRFTKAQILQMMQAAGLTEIRFSETDPFWCAVGRRT
jgi:ubiquinone/menaquinone biosynthesis C-methylase UbiE